MPKTNRLGLLFMSAFLGTASAIDADCVAAEHYGLVHGASRTTLLKDWKTSESNPAPGFNEDRLNARQEWPGMRQEA